MKPIIKSLLDLDYYKLTMLQFIHHYYKDVEVTFGFHNRTDSVQLARVIPEYKLRQQLDAIRALRFTSQEIKYLKKLGFAQTFLAFLTRVQLPEYNLRIVSGQYMLTFTGPWTHVTLWETLALSVVNELYYQELESRLSEKERATMFAEGKRRLHYKIQHLLQRPGIHFAEFGTRRRYSRDWQEYVVKTLAHYLPHGQLTGTSNVLLAQQYGLRPIGTMAHELFMVAAALAGTDDIGVVAAQNTILRQWWDFYGTSLSIALTDTFGSTFSFRTMPESVAQDWIGLRHDSGDPISFGKAAVAFYKRHGVDPRTKTIVFSDGLDIATISELEEYFQQAGRIKTSFGWGTNLTNDLGMFKPLSLVAKARVANGVTTVKLSDNLAKATGTPEQIKRYKKLFAHTSKLRTVCIY